MKRCIFLMLCASFLFSGCTAATTDPSKGGLFSYSPEAYEQRKVVRQERLAQLQRDQIGEERRQQALSNQLGSKNQERAAMQKKLGNARNDSSKLRKDLNAYKAQNEQQQAALANLKKRQERLAQDINAANSGRGMTEEDKAVEAERLRREIERLTNDTAALSAL